MRIGFTGHRNKITSELFIIHQNYPDATWVHGGAEGFDTQVDEYAKAHGIPVEVIKPDFKNYPPKYAPLKRNETIVDTTDVLVACYDGRETGGTKYTTDYAHRLGRQVIYLSFKEKHGKDNSNPK